MTRNRFTKPLLLSLCLLVALLVPVKATITAKLPVPLPANETLTYDFTPTTTGEVKATIIVQAPQGVTAQIFRPGQEKPIVEYSGSFPQTLTTPVGEPDVGKTWTFKVKNGTNRALDGRIELTYPKRYCKEAVEEFKFKMSYDPGNELEDYHCQMLLSILRSLPRPQLRRLTEIHAVSPDPALLGVYSSSVVTLFGLSASRSFALVAYHEIGHLVHLSTSTKDQRDRWHKLFEDSGRDRDNFILDPIDRTLYAMTNEFEDYAVTYSAYVANTQETIEEALNRRAAGRPLVFEKLKLLIEYFKYTDNNQQRIYIYRVGTDIPVPKIERASVPLTSDGLPDFSGEIKWETF